jgi:hypothetical protein
MSNTQVFACWSSRTKALIRWSIVETLAHAGHTVIEAADAAAAIRMLTDPPSPIDSVVLDTDGWLRAVSVSRHGASLDFGVPQRLFEIALKYTVLRNLYAVSDDGRHFWSIRRWKTRPRCR